MAGESSQRATAARSRNPAGVCDLNHKVTGTSYPSQLDIATKKVQTQVKQLAQKGQIGNAKLLAKEVVRSHKQKDRLSVNKARLGSINVQLQHQLCKFRHVYALEFVDNPPYSYGESYWDAPEVNRDNEVV